MSNTTTNAVDVPETPQDEQPKVKKNVASRIFAILFAALGIASLFLPFAYVLKGDTFAKTSFFTATLDLFKDKSLAKLFGFLPTYANVANTSVVGTVTALVYYVFLLLLAVSVILGIITVFTKKKAPAMLRITVFFFLFAYSLYTVWNITFAFAKNNKFLLDIMGISAVGVALVTYLVLSIKRAGKGAWISFIQATLSLGVAGIVLFSFENNTAPFATGLQKLKINNYQIVLLIIIGLFALNTMCAIIRMQLKKGLPFDFIRYFLQLVLATFVAVMELAHNKSAKLFIILTLVGAGVSLLQIVIWIFQVVAYKKAKKKAKQAEGEANPIAEEAPQSEEAPVQEYVIEEHVETIPYDGGPTDGVVTAEVAEDAPLEESQDVEETPVATPEQQPAQENVQTAGYDFYNTRSFDPFIATLNDAERNEFTELFILRCRGDLAEIPAYTVGAPSKEFFRKIFVYLGKYRDMLSNELMSKIYQFSLKLK